MSHIPRIFIAYARQDLPQLQQLKANLIVLERQNVCTVFYDGVIQAGEHWDKRLKDELHRADIFLLLVSTDFLASEYIHEIELPTILKRQQEGTAKVFPVILRHCLWKRTPLAQLQAILYKDEPIEVHNAYWHVAELVADAIDQENSNVPDAEPELIINLNQLDPFHGEMVFIKGGSFEMGDVMKDNEYSNETIHNVTLNDFLLSKYPITYAEYDAFCSNINRKFPNDWGHRRGKRPVTNVSWIDACEYCNWRSLEEDLNQVYQIRSNQVTANWSKNGYRLPTEAEWEYAARDGGKTTRFGNGKSIADPQEINFDGRKPFQKDYSIVGFFREKTVEVGSLPYPNEMGLHDMSGNIWEWCWDWYGDYSRKPQINPKGPDEGPFHVYRGGSWDKDASFVRVSYRPENLPANDFFNIGFRLARSVSF